MRRAAGHVQGALVSHAGLHASVQRGHGLDLLEERVGRRERRLELTRRRAARDGEHEHAEAPPRRGFPSVFCSIMSPSPRRLEHVRHRQPPMSGGEPCDRPKAGPPTTVRRRSSSSNDADGPRRWRSPPSASSGSIAPSRSWPTHSTPREADRGRRSSRPRWRHVERVARRRERVRHAHRRADARRRPASCSTAALPRRLRSPKARAGARPARTRCVAAPAGSSATRTPPVIAHSAVGAGAVGGRGQARATTGAEIGAHLDDRAAMREIERERLRGGRRIPCMLHAYARGRAWARDRRILQIEPRPRTRRERRRWLDDRDVGGRRDGEPSTVLRSAHRRTAATPRRRARDRADERQRVWFRWPSQGARPDRPGLVRRTTNPRPPPGASRAQP